MCLVSKRSDILEKGHVLPLEFVICVWPLPEDMRDWLRLAWERDPLCSIGKRLNHYTLDAGEPQAHPEMLKTAILVEPDPIEIQFSKEEP